MLYCGTHTKWDYANCEVLLAQIAIQEGRYDDADRHSETSYIFNSQDKNIIGQASAIYTNADANRRSGNMEKAKESYETALQLNEIMENEKMIRRVQRCLAEIETDDDQVSLSTNEEEG